jgi:hypothetical protein
MVKVLIYLSEMYQEEESGAIIPMLVQNKEVFLGAGLQDCLVWSWSLKASSD